MNTRQSKQEKAICFDNRHWSRRQTLTAAKTKLSACWRIGLSLSKGTSVEGFNNRLKLTLSTLAARIGRAAFMVARGERGLQFFGVLSGDQIPIQQSV